jgi:hypothetical protein
MKTKNQACPERSRREPRTNTFPFAGLLVNQPILYGSWLRRILLALLIGIVLGGVAYLTARGVAGAVLLSQQGEILGSIGGFSLDAPPASDLRALRRELRAIEATYQQISILVGIVIGLLSAIVAYLRMEYAQSE